MPSVPQTVPPTVPPDAPPPAPPLRPSSPALAAVRLSLYGVIVGALCGLGSAAFLAMLEAATIARVENPWVPFLLPVAGALAGFVLGRWGGPISPGANLVIDAAEHGGTQVPLRMAPIVLLGSVWTHLFGGSAGREGAAVQIGASLADWLSHGFGAFRWLAASPTLRRTLLLAGVAGGFGSVFGTPAAGAIFALEFAIHRQVAWSAAVPAVIASFVGDFVTRAVGVRHTDYPQVNAVAFSPMLAAKWIAFAVAMALVTIAFIELLRGMKRVAARFIQSLPLRMACGGLAVLLLWQIAGTDDYLGLGVPTILRAFVDTDLPANAFAWKLVFTATTLAVGFLGGEVTPLFFVGACAGNTLSQRLGIPLELGAGVGMAAVFAAASNAPIALSVMAAELLGVAVLPHALIVCVIAFALTGNRSIYSSQYVGAQKVRERLRGLWGGRARGDRGRGDRTGTGPDS